MLIPPEKIKILLLGEEYHAKVFNEQLENYEKSVFEPKYYNELPSNEVLETFDLFHLISSPIPVIKKLRRYKRPVFYHWIGTDVYRFINDAFIKRFFKKLIINSPIVRNLVVSENLKYELQQYRVESTIFPLTKLKFVDDIPPLPEKFSVLSYVPKNRWDFYHGDLITELSIKMPDVDFHILAAGKNSGRTNLFFYDFIHDTIPFYKKCSVLLRFTVHDGLPKMVLEALSNGRQVLWNETFPHCFAVNNLDECVEILNKLKLNCPLNTEGKKFVQDSFNESKIIGSYYQLCKNILFNQ
ncbi:MAG: hypothetical protein IH618_12935 [Ignavibacteriaceae bacterium]|nr:hypothetical protein [Ignavibacteriaceae bacterium]